MSKKNDKPEKYHFKTLAAIREELIKTTKPTRGRPSITITQAGWGALDGLCFAQASEEEIADYMGISIDTLCRKIKEQYGKTFQEYSAEARKSGLASLRSKMWREAMKGNTKILLHLAKHLLGQHDKNIVYNRDDNGQFKKIDKSAITPDVAQESYFEMVKNTSLVLGEASDNEADN